MLREQNADIQDDGKLRITQRFASTKSNLRFALATFNRVLNLNFQPDYTLQGWNALQEIIKARNRLMHPKTASDLEISDKTMKAVFDANAWMAENAMPMIVKGHDKLMKFRAESEIESYLMSFFKSASPFDDLA
jgi:hypothetical protein